MWLGVDYYPEQWPEERWPVDARMMKEAGLGLVRLADSAWSRLEPEQGRFDFDWLDRAIDILQKEGIKVVLATPTAAPPAWLIHRYPDILPQDYTRTPKSFGIRRHYCFNNRHFHDATRRITAAMARRYNSHPAVMGWQIDSQLGCHDTTRCYCDACAAAFRHWLEDKYCTLQCLNDSWGTVFWSQEFTDWDQVPLPWKSVENPMSYNPSLLLDYFRFSSDSLLAYQKIQVDILRDLCPRQFVTHNLLGLFDQIDYFDLGRELDFVSWVNFPNYSDSSPHWTGMSHDIMRGIKRCNYWVMEQQAGAVGWNTSGQTPRPGHVRMWAYQSIGHGADAVLFFRWRTSRFGTEQFWHGILNHDGLPGARYEEVKRMGAEVAEWSKHWSGGCPASTVAFLLSYEQNWAFQIQPQNPALTYWHEVFRLYEPLRKMGVGVDFIGAAGNLQQYKLIVAPLLLLTDAALAAKLREYVADGGRLVGTFRSGVKDMCNVVLPARPPGPLTDLFGISISDYDSARSGATSAVEVIDTHARYSARVWADLIELGSAGLLARFTSDFYAGHPAVTVNELGKGKAYYIGTVFEQEFYPDFYKPILDDCGITRLDWVPDGVDAAVRYKDGKRVIFLVNAYRNTAKFTLEAPWRSLLTQENLSGQVDLPGYDVMILEEIGP